MSGHDQYLLAQRGLYYRPGNAGYTGIKALAGRYSQADAIPASGVLAVHVSEAPDFSPACFDDLAREHLKSTVDELLVAGQGILDRMFSTYKAGNGRDVGIEADDGEKCWIVHSDDIEALRAAIAKARGEQP